MRHGENLQTGWKILEFLDCSPPCVEWLEWNCLLGCLLCSLCLLVKLFGSVCLSGYLRKAWWRVGNRVCIWSWGIRLILLWPLILFRFCFLGWLLYQINSDCFSFELGLIRSSGCVSSKLWCISLECSKLSLLLVINVFLLYHIRIFILRRFFHQLLPSSLSHLGKPPPPTPSQDQYIPCPTNLLHIPQPPLSIVRVKNTTVWSLYTPRQCVYARPCVSPRPCSAVECQSAVSQ